MPNTLASIRAAAQSLATWRAPHKRAEHERIGLYPSAGAYFMDGENRHLGTFRVVYERGHLPTPGAMAYAYMSQGLAPVSPCGPGFDIQGPGWRAFQPPQSMTGATVSLTGIPTRAGQIITAPLIDTRK